MTWLPADLDLGSYRSFGGTPLLRPFINTWYPILVGDSAIQHRAIMVIRLGTDTTEGFPTIITRTRFIAGFQRAASVDKWD